MVAHCLFEQSGTFKNEFKKLGVEAYDYDIQNEFGETDFQIDLFAEIAKSYEGGVSVFDNFKSGDIVMAFFPCTRFETKIIQHLVGNTYQQKSWTDERKIEYSRELHSELSVFYDLFCKMFIVALRKGIKMVIENPNSNPHYLTMFFPVKARLIDKDRRQNGESRKKPTSYWFINCEPKENLVFEPLTYVMPERNDYTYHRDGLDRETLRSMIHPQYASRFIRQYILPKEDKIWQHSTN